MLIENIGNAILKLRKAKNITQEELAKILNVTNQAVSKWECGGGFPDIELLPLIADYFNVSIDKLFGRNISDYSDINTETAKYIQSFDDSAKMKAAMEHCWTIERSLFNSDIKRFQKGNTLEELNRGDLYYETYSQLLDDNGITFMRLNEDFQYFMLILETQLGFGKVLNFTPEYQKLFNMLGDEDSFKCIYLLYQRENKPFTPKLFEKHFGIKQERAIEILNRFKEYGLIETTEIELDDEIQSVYTFNPNASFIPLLTFAREIIHPPQSFHNNCNQRTKPYLQKKED
ncbi:MAG: helix-turn-helix domain-containing protein [Oscillospiraceae bacterium]|nr:helix-turn-helix domain-containing protein [Oscillospiraceae bacterium]